MKISISSIQQVKEVSNIDAAIAKKVSGGASLESSASTRTNYNNTNVAIGRATVFGLISSSGIADVSSSSLSGEIDGVGYSVSTSSSAAVSS